jgi:hypothetical protein
MGISYIHLRAHTLFRTHTHTHSLKKKNVFKSLNVGSYPPPKGSLVYLRRTALRIFRAPPTLPVLSKGLAPGKPAANPGDGASGGLNVAAGGKLKPELTAGGAAFMPN